MLRENKKRAPIFPQFPKPRVIYIPAMRSSSKAAVKLSGAPEALQSLREAIRFLMTCVTHSYRCQNSASVWSRRTTRMLFIFMALAVD